MNLKEKIVNFIKDYITSSKAKGIIVGMSGGKDSFVTAALSVHAVGKENVFGAIIPDGDMKDIEIAKKECEYLNIKYEIININSITSEIIKNTIKALNTNNLSETTTLNISPRIRMVMLYSLAGTLGYLVANTSNLSETMIGYTTKWGDNVGDFSPLGDLTKTEVCQLGLEMGLPKEYIEKAPSDGLSGKTDEEKIGFKYNELDEYIRFGKNAKNIKTIQKMYQNSIHKRKNIPKFKTNKKNYLKNRD